MAFVQTPKGFRVNIDDRSLSYYCGILKDVYNQASFGKLTNMVRLQTIEIIKSLVSGTFPNPTSLNDWFIKLLESDDLNEVKLTLVRDTIRYMETGYRRLPLATYEVMFHETTVDESKSRSTSIISFDNLARHQQTKDTAKTIIMTIRNLDPDNGLIMKWLSQEDGFIDMVRFFIFILDD